MTTIQRDEEQRERVRQDRRLFIALVGAMEATGAPESVARNIASELMPAIADWHLTELKKREVEARVDELERITPSYAESFDDDRRMSLSERIGRLKAQLHPKSKKENQS